MSSEKENFKKFTAKDAKKKYTNIGIKRKPKEFVYADCKLELKHLFYVNHHTQMSHRHRYFPNLTLENCSIDKYKDLPRHTFPYHTLDEPYPVYVARKHCQRVDPCFRRTIARSYYRQRLLTSRASYQNALKDDRKLRKLEKEDTYYYAIYTFAERLECDPDPYFYGNYDYYYTGGNLCVLSGENQYVMHVDDLDPSTIRASKIRSNSDSNHVQLEELAKKSLPNKDEIFEIAAMHNINSSIKNIVGIRQRHNITILEVLPETENLNFVAEFKTKSCPTISFAQSKDIPEMFVLTTMKENVHVYDISRTEVNITNKVKQTQTGKNPINWNTVKFLENQSFLYANERELYVMDFRIPQTEWRQTFCNFSSNEFPCEMISSLEKSKFDNLFYVGSTHKLRCLDKRFISKKTFFENVSVCEWTHQMDSSPLLLSTYLHRNERECIFIASPIAGDLRLCELAKTPKAEFSTECSYNSHCLPWQPPTLKEAYSSSCLTGKTLQPEADFKQRIRCCTTGLAIYEENLNLGNDTKNLMLWANSNGDVYAQNLQKRTEHDSGRRTSQRSNNVMIDYASKISEITQPDLNYTDIVDFQGICKALLCESLSRETKKSVEETDIEESKPKEIFKGGWQKSMSTLHSYKDALAQDLLSIWDIPIDQGVLDIKYSELRKKFELKKSDICKWLDSVQAPTVTVPLQNLTTSAVELDNLEFLPANAPLPEINEADMTYLNSSGFETDCTFPMPSFASKKPKLAKPKKKHVKGF